MLRQITAIKFKPEARQQALDEIGEGFAEICGVVAGIRRFEYGPDMGLIDGAYDYALVIDFDNLESWRAYRDHPDHLAFAARFAPFAEAAVRVQYALR